MLAAARALAASGGGGAVVSALPALIQQSARRGCHTIYALATGAPPTAIAIVRVSGPGAGPALAGMLRGQPRPRHGQAALRTLFPPLKSYGSDGGAAAAVAAAAADDDGARQAAPLDRAVVIWWSAPRSYTGEDVVELHLHGGPAVVRAVTTALGASQGVRPAQPGEFTRRAFRNGKMDLTQAEGVHDIVAAETEAQRAQAMRYVSAEAAALYEGWRADILRCMAHVEAFIDFGEDEGIEDDVMQRVLERLAGLRAAMAEHLARAGCGERLRNGVRVAVVGKPNVGKSTLMNYLVGRGASIVADRPGTTRDVIEVSGDVGGYPVAFVDTAGVRHRADGGGPPGSESSSPGSELDPVEVEGVRRAEAAAAGADLRLCVQDVAAGPGAMCAAAGGEAPCRCKGLAAQSSADARTVVVLNKTDLVCSVAEGHWTAESSSGSSDGGAIGDGGDSGVVGGPVRISCKERAGLRGLVARLQREVAELCGGGGGGAASGPVVQMRHRGHLKDCIAAIDRVLADPADVVVAAEELRSAAEQFGYITGRLDTEAVLDVVFAEFCIGK